MEKVSIFFIKNYRAQLIVTVHCEEELFIEYAFQRVLEDVLLPNKEWKQLVATESQLDEWKVPKGSEDDGEDYIGMTRLGETYRQKNEPSSGIDETYYINEDLYDIRVVTESELENYERRGVVLVDINI